MRPDVVEKLGNSTIQHGKYNDRIYAMKVATQDTGLPAALKELANREGYTKIFAKVPAGRAREFLDEGYQCEAEIPRFIRGREDALILSCFLDDRRRKSRTPKKNERVMEACREKRDQPAKTRPPRGAVLRVAGLEEADAVAELYSHVFPTYPFPIMEPGYIRETMAENVVYFGIWKEGRLIALSSVEMDLQASNVEMTDFATLPNHRSQGLASVLLNAMEDEMQQRGMRVAYSIARAPSFGMNITFAKMGYTHGGRLINNTNIGGRFEDMNIWHKAIDAHQVLDSSERTAGHSAQTAGC